MRGGSRRCCEADKQHAASRANRKPCVQATGIPGRRGPATYVFHLRVLPVYQVRVASRSIPTSLSWIVFAHAGWGRFQPITIPMASVKSVLTAYFSGGFQVSATGSSLTVHHHRLNKLIEGAWENKLYSLRSILTAGYVHDLEPRPDKRRETVSAAAQM